MKSWIRTDSNDRQPWYGNVILFVAMKKRLFGKRLDLTGENLLKFRLVIGFIAKGCLIGVAFIIPGVSGGTMAIVLGIYERLIRALHQIGFSTVQKCLGAITLKKDKISEAHAELRRIDVGFLAALVIGATLAIKALSALIVYLLKNQHDPTHGFFCGLILASIIIPAKMLKRFTGQAFISMLIAIALTVGLSLSITGEDRLENARKKDELEESRRFNVSATGKITPETDRERVDYSVIKLLYLFFCGAVSASAMILPGISGSFLLMFLGVYFDVLAAVNHLGWLVLAIFAAGCGIGLLAFTRLVNYVLERYRDLTISFLIGLMVGSLYRLWPFWNFEFVGRERIDVAHIIPQVNMNMLITALAFLAGCGVILLFYRFDQRESA